MLFPSGGELLWTNQAAPGERQAVEKLLKDPNPEVRLGAALALAKANHAAAVPVLIDLLAVLPYEAHLGDADALVDARLVALGRAPIEPSRDRH